MSERNNNLLLQDIREAIVNILNFTCSLSFNDYCNDIKTKNAVAYNFMIIGEAAARLSQDFKTNNTPINWRQLKDFRNIIVHDYFGIDDNIVWNIIEFNLSGLLKQIDSIVKNNQAE